MITKKLTENSSATLTTRELIEKVRDLLCDFYEEPCHFPLVFTTYAKKIIKLVKENEK